MKKLGSRTRLLVLLAAVLCLFQACSSEKYLEEADLEVYDIISKKQDVVLGKSSEFAIAEGEKVEELKEIAREDYTKKQEQAHTDSLSRRYEEGWEDELQLAAAMEVAFENNRTFQSQKEDLYISALNLTLQRYLWTPIFYGAMGGEATRNELDQRFVAGDVDFSVSQLLAQGGEASLSMATDLLHFYSGASGETARSVMTFDFLQPLWRGAGSLVAQENLTQAERNVAYQVRDFERFRRTFAVSVATNYYRVLQQKDTAKNEKSNFSNLTLNRERSEEFAKAGRTPEFEKDQVRQDELRAENRWILARERFDEQVDSFKITLGLPMAIVLLMDSEDLHRLTEAGLKHPNIDLERAVDYALEHRMDLINTRDGMEDARRRVLIAEDGLGPDLDFKFTYRLHTDDTQPLDFKSQHPYYSGGLDLDLPLDRRSERNSYRKSIIDLERQKRSLTLAMDQVIQDVRSSYRALNQARESYDIQVLSLELAMKRVESTEIMLQAGRADTRDYLDSQESLLDAQNNLTTAIVEHTIALLNFLLDVEALRVDEKGNFDDLRGSYQEFLIDTSGGLGPLDEEGAEEGDGIEQDNVDAQEISEAEIEE